MFSTKPNQPTPATTVKTSSDTTSSSSGRPVAQTTSTKSSQGLNRPCNLNTKDQEHLLLCDLN